MYKRQLLGVARFLVPSYLVVVVTSAHLRISDRVELLLKLLAAARGLGRRRWMQKSLSCLRSVAASAIGLLGHDNPMGGNAT